MFKHTRHQQTRTFIFCLFRCIMLISGDVTVSVSGHWWFGESTSMQMADRLRCRGRGGKKKNHIEKWGSSKILPRCMVINFWVSEGCMIRVWFAVRRAFFLIRMVEVLGVTIPIPFPPICSALANEGVAQGDLLAIRNNLGGFVNHAFFWKCMAPNPAGEPGSPTGALLQKIQSQWGSFEVSSHFFAPCCVQKQKCMVTTNYFINICWIFWSNERIFG